MSKLDEISLYEKQLQVVIRLLIIQIYSASYTGTLVFVYLGDFLKVYKSQNDSLWVTWWPLDKKIINTKTLNQYSSFSKS